MSGSVKDFVINVLGDTSKADLKFDAFGRHTKKTFGGVFNSVDGGGKRAFSALSGVAKTAMVGIGVGLAALAIGAGNFAKDSITAFSEAETQQSKLADAFKRFPALSDTNQKALGKLNSQLAKKTKYDDDATASGQAVLAGFKLTGTQIKTLTPLLQDYASKTGKDIPTAAEDLGKAVLGQGKALKGIGLQFQDLHDPTANFTQLVDGLTTKVGGFAANEGTTAAGKLEILKNRFGEVQEKVGGALMPAMDRLATFTNTNLMPALEGISGWVADTGIPAISDFIGWIDKEKGVLVPVVGIIGGVAGAYGIWTGAQWLLNAAMDANPIGLVVLAIEALIVVVALAITHTKELTDFGISAFQSINLFAIGVVKSFAGVAQNVVNGAVDAINAILNPIDVVMRALGLPSIKLGRVNFTAILDAASATVKRVSAQAFSDNSGAASGKNGGGGGPAPRKMADGAVVRSGFGGVYSHIGEGKYDEAVLPLSPAVLAQLGGGKPAAAPASGPFTGKLYLEGGALLGIVRGEIQQHDRGNVMTSKMGKQG